MVNQTKLAEKLGISQRAVSFALSGQPGVSEKTRQRVLQAASEMGYRPSAAATQLRSRKTGHIGVLFHDSGSKGPSRSHGFEFITGINSILENAGYLVSLVQMTAVETEVFGVRKVFTEHRLDGMVVMVPLHLPVREQIGKLMERCIWCDAGARLPEACLWRDETEAARLATRAAVKSGAKKLLWATAFVPDDDHPYLHAKERDAGVREIAEQSDVELITFPITSWRPLDASQLKPYLKPDVCVIASDYHIGPQIASMALTLGQRAGHDFGLVSVDEDSQLQTFFPWIGRATYDRYTLGQKAGEMMLARLTNESASIPSVVDQPTWIDGILPRR
jgi:DNA-binding LacI/PurR family transcriptional regulator